MKYPVNFQYIPIIAFSMPIAALQGHNRSRLRATPWPMRNEPLVVDPYMRLRIVFWSNGKLQNELVMWILRFRWPLIYPLVNPPVLKPSVNLKRNDQLFANQITRGYRRRLKMISLASRAILLVSSKNKDVAPKKPGVAASSSTLSPLPFLGFLACKKITKLAHGFRRRRSWLALFFFYVSLGCLKGNLDQKPLFLPWLKGVFVIVQTSSNSVIFECASSWPKVEGNQHPKHRNSQICMIF